MDTFCYCYFYNNGIQSSLTTYSQKFYIFSSNLEKMLLKRLTPTCVTYIKRLLKIEDY